MSALFINQCKSLFLPSITLLLIDLHQRLKEIGRQLGFKIYNQISLKRGISERPTNILEIFKNIKTKVFKHLFNYELSAEINSYKI